MTRLIDADLVAEKIKAKCNSGQWAEAVVYGMEKALYLVKTAPTVERPRGEWKYESYGQYLSTYKCSNCGFHGDKQWICCPYCGADMRKEGGVDAKDPGNR